MNDSFRKTKSGMKKDFSKDVMRQLDYDGSYNLKFNPLIKVAIAFVVTVLSLTAIIVFALSMT